VENKESKKLNTIKAVLDKMEIGFTAKSKICGTSTGIYSLDRITSGVTSGDFWVVAGRPVMGKTSLLLSLASHIALREHTPSWVISGDQSEESLIQMILGGESQINISNLERGNLRDSDWPKIINIANSISDSRLFIKRQPWIDVTALRENIINSAYGEAEFFPKCIFIDKFNSLTMAKDPQVGANNRAQELNRCAVELKNIAVELGLAIIISCDINKGIEERANRRPCLQDLRDFSGALESYSDFVLGLYRGELYERKFEEPDDLAEIVIMKSRRLSEPMQAIFHSEIARWYDKSELNRQKSGRDLF